MRGRWLVLLGVVAACGEDTAPRTVTGSWSGATMVSSLNFVVNADLEDAGGTVSGTGHVASAGIDCDPDIAGSRSGSTVSLTLNCAGYTPFTYTADLAKNGRTLTGSLSGSGFDNDVLVLTRQN